MTKRLSIRIKTTRGIVSICFEAKLEFSILVFIEIMNHETIEHGIRSVRFELIFSKCINISQHFFCERDFYPINTLFGAMVNFKSFKKTRKLIWLLIILISRKFR